MAPAKSNLRPREKGLGELLRVNRGTVHPNIASKCAVKFKLQSRLSMNIRCKGKKKGIHTSQLGVTVNKCVFVMPRML